MGQIPPSCTKRKDQPPTYPPVFLQHYLQSEFDRLLDAAVSENTHKVQKVGILSYKNFCRQTGLAYWPPTLCSVVQYLVHLSSSGLAYSTARSYLSAISYHCKLQGIDDPTSEFLITKLLQGMKRLNQKSDRRLPITKNMLEKIILILPCTCTNSYEADLFAAAFSLAFHGLFRVGELTVHSRIPNNTVLKRENLTLDPVKQLLLINIQHSKTDQVGKGTILQLEKLEGAICPFKLVEKYLSVRPRVAGPLFCHFDTSPLTRYQFTAVLTKAITRLQIPEHTRYKSHSFRIGASTELAMRGFSSETIKKCGRWKSSCYKSYIRLPKF